MPRRDRSGIVVAAIAAAAVAALAVLLLAPDRGAPEPASVPASDYFTEAQVERAEDFRAGQRNLTWLGLAIELAALTLLALGRPRGLRRLLERAGDRPVLGAAAAGAGISVGLAILALPAGLAAHERAVDFGLSTQDLGGWLADRAASAAIAAAFAAIGAMVLLAIQRRLPRTWWVPASAVVVAYAVVTTWLAPVLLAPVFNDFEPVPEGPLRDRVVELADRAGVEVGEVLRVDASRRGTTINAYVNGIGSTRRVVLYDNLIDDADMAELEAVLAHELGHVAADDIGRGIAFVALVAPLGMLTVALAGGALARRSGAQPGSPAALPAYALALSLVAFGMGIAGAALSRRMEARADTFALELTGNARAQVELQRRLALTNLSDPDPSGPLDTLLRTHPSTLERIGAAVAFGRESAPDAEKAAS